jgi:hypothetical protein
VNSRIPLRADTVAHELEDERQVVLYDAEHKQLLVLTELGAAVWFLMNGQRSEAEISQQIVGALAVNAAEVARDVEAFLQALEARGFIAYQ